MEKNATVDAGVIANDVREALQGKLDDAKLGEAIKQMQASVAQYPAQAQLACAVFYQQVSCQITGKKNFTGHAGGLCFPGGNGTWGNLFTDDLDRLYNNMQAFSFLVTPVYFTIEFWDASSRLLGHFHGGGIGTSTGTGGGTGSWK
jgi:hypothetical protein